MKDIRDTIGYSGWLSALDDLGKVDNMLVNNYTNCIDAYVDGELVGFYDLISTDGQAWENVE